MNVENLNGQTLDRAYESADYLCKVLGLDHVDPMYVKLDELRTKLRKERGERRELAKQD